MTRSKTSAQRRTSCRRTRHAPIELVDIHGVDAAAELPVFPLEPPDRFLVLTPFIAVAGVQRLTHPGQHLVIELEPAEQHGELLCQQILAHIAMAPMAGPSPVVGTAAMSLLDPVMPMPALKPIDALRRGGRGAPAF